MKKLIYLLKDFEKISFFGYSTWKNGYKVFQIIPSTGFEWDVQCRPVAENGKVVLDGYREFTIFFEWLWFMGAICFEFKWTVRNPKDFEQIPPTESELKDFNNLFEKFTSKKIEKLPQEKIEKIEDNYNKTKADELKEITFKNCDKLCTKNKLSHPFMNEKGDFPVHPFTYTSDKWLEMFKKEYPKLELLDPDGWDRKNYNFSFNQENITKQEFIKRLCNSTCNFGDFMVFDAVMKKWEKE